MPTSAGCGAAVETAVGAASSSGELAGAAQGLVQACVAAIPYAPATAFLAREKAKLADIPDGTGRGGRRAEGDTPRVAILADGIGSTHGVARTIVEIRERGVPGFEIEVLGTDPAVDRRLPSVAEIDVPFYPGLRIGVPSLPVAVQALADGGFDAVHVCTPGPAGISGALLARALGLPLIGSYHTELTAYAGVRSGEQRLADAMALAVGCLLRRVRGRPLPQPRQPTLHSPAIGVCDDRVQRWDRGVDTSRFDPSLARRRRCCRGEINVLYSGRISNEKGVELLAESFLRAREREPRLHLILAGGGPEEDILRERLGPCGHVPGMARGTGSSPAPTRAPTCSSSRARPTRSVR